MTREVNPAEPGREAYNYKEGRIAVKKRMVVALMCFTLIAGAAALSGLFTGGEANAEKLPPVNAEAADTGVIAPVKEETAPKYIVKLCEDGLGVYAGDSTSPTFIAEIDVEGLRYADRVMLLRGLEVSTYEEVLGLIEDFGP